MANRIAAFGCRVKGIVMSTLDQSKRFLQITTGLGENEVVLTGFRGQEQISRLFRFELDLLSDNKAVSPKDVVGKPVTFSCEYEKDKRRYFNGIVSRFSVGNLGINKRRSYRAEVVPSFWLFQKRSDCRIFQQMSVMQILDKVLSGIQPEFNVTGPHPIRDYCVQYRETDFNFASRLMEEEGIYYYFRHEDGKHTMVISDNAEAYGKVLGNSIDYPEFTGRAEVKNTFSSWEHVHEFRTGKWAQRDYNFETPSQTLDTNSQARAPFTGAESFEYYDYPGLYLKTGDGKPLTDTRMGEEEFDIDVVQASSNCSTLSAGLKLTVGKHQIAEENGKVYIVSVIHHIANEPLAYETGVAPSVDYTNSFTCLPDNMVVRPDRITPKPVIQGLQTAVVTGPQGEEIHCDKYGRVKVQFFWDRLGKKDENTSCWIRTTHNVAGKHWGFKAIPRIGQEVVVNFLEGDPDRPIILGGIYNAEQMPHYDLDKDDDNRTKTYIKTNSTKGGAGFNELMFDDLAGKERLYMHGQNSMDVVVNGDSREKIGGSRHQIIGQEKDGQKSGDQKEHVFGDKHQTVEGTHLEKIGGNVHLEVGGADGQHGRYSHETHGDVAIAARDTGNMLIYADNDLTVQAMNNAYMYGREGVKLSGTKVEVKSREDGTFNVAKNLVIQAGMSLTLKGPGGHIVIDASGVSIQGTMVLINSGGAPAGQPVTVDDPTDTNREEGQPTDPDEAWNSKTGQKSAP
jgi:type VI secretion system secreted protein VgrG